MASPKKSSKKNTGDVKVMFSLYSESDGVNVCFNSVEEIEAYLKSKKANPLVLSFIDNLAALS